MRAKDILDLCGLVGRLTARQFARFCGFLGLSRPGFRVVRVNGAHCPLGQLAKKASARFRLASPSRKASRWVFLYKPRYRVLA